MIYEKNISLFDGYCNGYEFECTSKWYNTMESGDRFYLSSKW